MDKSIAKAKFRTVDFPSTRKLNSVLFYGCVRTPIRSHIYFIIDLWHSKCHIVELSSLYTLTNFYKCLKAVKDNNYREYKTFPLARTLFQDGTYNLKQWALLVGSNLAHYSIFIGNKKFWIGNAGTPNALICDLEKQEVTSFTPTDEGDILGPQVSFDPSSESVFFLSYDIKGPNQIGLVDPSFKNRFSIRRFDQRNDRIETLWEDRINCLLVDGFQVTRDQRFAIFSDLRFALDENNQFDPNSIYIVDLEKDRKWEIPDLKASAHIQLDPDDPHVFYASEHQIGIIVRDRITEADEAKNKEISLFAKLDFVTKQIGGFVGVASLFKYRITENGPVLLGTFNAGKDFVRATWHFVFKNRGRKFIGTISSPHILVIDAETMQLHKKIDTGIKPVYGLQVSEDGEEFYCNSFFDFYVVDFESGAVKASFNFQERKKGQVFHASTHTTRVDNFY